MQSKYLLSALLFIYPSSGILTLCRHAAENKIVQGKLEIALKNKTLEASRLEERLAGIEAKHAAELEKVKTAAATSVSEATKRLEDAVREHKDALVVASAQTASV